MKAALQSVALAAVIAAGAQYTVIDAQGHVIGTLTTDAPVTTSAMRIIGIARAGSASDVVPSSADRSFHPDYSRALSVEQMTRAWRDEIDRLNPPLGAGGG
ncbi:MAG: hypothetical protein JOZ24_05030 [Candidatus Eremiobacteraeota bacterium]|nr:hypothetical protein [Candidatus Eremiobacteraeota bacterium]